MSKRALQRLCVYLIAAIWWPLSAFSHAHMTAMIAQSIGDEHHPGLVAAHDVDAPNDWAADAKVIVVDAALFWDAVDQYEGECGFGAFCASMSSAAPMPSAASVPAQSTSPAHFTHSLVHASRVTAPDTPPPRTHL
jgi:hypothetical protein